MVGMWGRRLGVSAVAAAVGLTVMVAFGVAAVGAGHPRAAAQAAIPAFPRVGPVQTVDVNDVGDPFVVAVPAGIEPPRDVPFQVSGPDAYVSAPWSDASAAAAKANGWYVLFGTTDWVGNVPTAISTDLVHWTQAPDSLPVLPVWAAHSSTMTWGPSVLRLDGRWVMYYSTEEAASGRECIGRSVSASPTGPYVDASANPLVCQRGLGGSIDPTIVHGASDGLFVLWKNDGNSAGGSTAIWSQRLSPDGATLLGGPSRLLVADQPWERGIVEAPAMIPASAGGYWLLYAGGQWESPSYGTGLAYCRTASGPCAATAKGPFLATSTSVTSPGALDSFTDLHGQLWVGFTALVLVPAPWNPGHQYYNRVLDIAPVLSR